MTNYNSSKTYKVIIIGGGPAGIATSLSLQSRGISHCIIESKTAPIDKAGEVLPPNAKPLLKKMGLLPLVKHTRHIPYYGNKSCWGTNNLQQKEFIRSVHGHGYLLDRAFFETQLWEYVDTSKVDFYKGYALKKVYKLGDSIEVLISDLNDTVRIEAPYIVDATGRKASVCRQLQIPKIQIDQQFSLIIKGKLKQPMQRQICIEAVENGWWYLAPKANKEVVLMFFTSKGCISSTSDISDFLKMNFQATLHLSKLEKQLDISFENSKTLPAGTSRLQIPYNECCIAVGDAAYSYDPISSYGITSALASGYYAGHALGSMLEGEENAFEAYHYLMEQAFDSYMKELVVQYGLEKRWEGSQYWVN